MKRTVALISVLLVVACNKSPEAAFAPPPSPPAESLLTKQRLLTSTLEQKGLPRSSWSESELDAYQVQLKELSGVEAELGPKTVDNTAVIAQRQAALEAARRHLGSAHVKDLRSLVAKVDQSSQLLRSKMYELGSSLCWDKKDAEEILNLVRNNQAEVAATLSALRSANLEQNKFIPYLLRQQEGLIQMERAMLDHKRGMRADAEDPQARRCI